ncbi:sterol desaturase family protein [Corallococcus macrosporus]|uniref:Sterol desaturase family protein n=1 Tax=Myxococcus fulvus (strain ATCC BAA-855 / HW-1) TaxID=483219 RepID=F8CCK8_MYXFH|nr:sterol desaturase family protein [Corallococcus macrosporus]AEI62262.1 sterol desaturase family protein [Corallococcus macrosporus]
MVQGFLKLLPVVFVVSGGLKAVILWAGWKLTHLKSAARLRVYRRAFGKGQLRSEVRAALIVIGCDALLISAFRAFHDERFAPFRWTATLLTFAWMFVMFEAWFYVTHRLMHTRALYWIHAQHHVAQVTNPITSLSFSVAERVVLLGGAFMLVTVAGHFMPITQAGLVLYILTNYSLNVLAHGNTEWVPGRFVSSWAGRLFFTTTFHAMHHARYQGHYGLFTPVLDRWLGTAFADYPQVHARARAGQGLERLGERIRLDAPSPTVSAPAPGGLGTS